MEIRREHSVGRDVLFGHLPVRVDLAFRVRTCTQSWCGAPNPPCSRFQPSILQFVPGSLPWPSHAAKKAVREMIDVPVGSEVDRGERDLLAVSIVAVVLSLCAGKVEEKIVERTVLLNDEDDVRDRRDGGAKPNGPALGSAVLPPAPQAAIASAARSVDARNKNRFICAPFRAVAGPPWGDKEEASAFAPASSFRCDLWIRRP